MVCRITIDNVINEIRYEGTALTVTPADTASLGSWTTLKTFTFESTETGTNGGGALEIWGSETGAASTCIVGGTCGCSDKSGMLLACTSTDTNSVWHNYQSNTDTLRSKSKGSCVGAVTDTACPYLVDVVASTSDFNLNANTLVIQSIAAWSTAALVPIWAGLGNGGTKWAYFKLFAVAPGQGQFCPGDAPASPPPTPSPNTVTCLITADNFLHKVMYNDIDLTWTYVPGCAGCGGSQDWTKIKTFSFTEAPGNGGGRLRVWANEIDSPTCTLEASNTATSPNLCASGDPQSGLLIRCTGGSVWDGYKTNSDTLRSRAIGNCASAVTSEIEATVCSEGTSACVSDSQFHTTNLRLPEAFDDAVPIWVGATTSWNVYKYASPLHRHHLNL